MIEAVERSGDAEGYVKGVLDRGERLMGFGHRVYRAEDPRARVLRRTAKELGAPRFEVAEALEKAALAELHARKPDRVLATNVEFWSAVVLDFAEVPAHMFTSMFTCARVAGWSAHILEQKELGRLVRPSATYVGPGTAQARARSRAGTRSRTRLSGSAASGRGPRGVGARGTWSAAPPAVRRRVWKDRSVADVTASGSPTRSSPPTAGSAAGRRKVRPEAVAALAGVATDATSARPTGRRRCKRPGRAAARGASPSSSSLPDGYEVVLGNGGTTAFWEVAAFGLIRDRAQFASFGEFGAKFAKAVEDAPFLGDADRAQGRAGQRAPTWSPRPASTPTAPPHNETSTGVAVPVTRVAGADPGALHAASTPPRPPAASTSTSPRPTSTTSRRRSASAPTAGSGSR